jgi:hypothetical protein
VIRRRGAPVSGTARPRSMRRGRCSSRRTITTSSPARRSIRSTRTSSCRDSPLRSPRRRPNGRALPPRSSRRFARFLPTKPTPRSSSTRSASRAAVGRGPRAARRARPRDAGVRGGGRLLLARVPAWATRPKIGPRPARAERGVVRRNPTGRRWSWRTRCCAPRSARTRLGHHLARRQAVRRRAHPSG